MLGACFRHHDRLNDIEMQGVGDRAVNVALWSHVDLETTREHLEERRTAINHS